MTRPRAKAARTRPPFATLALGLALAGMAGMAGCDSDSLTSANDNPNNPTDAPPGPLFTSAISNAVRRWMGGHNFTQTSAVVQHLAMNQYTDEDRYAGLRANATTGTFESAYTNELQDLRQLVLKGEASTAPRISGPARVLQTWEFSLMTNAFGDIPYSDALKADSAVLAPTYDAQKDIYDGFFATLGAASAAMAGAPASSAGLAGADPMYGGDMAKWQRFANSLRARLALQVVNVDPTKADAQLRAALTAPGGVFTGNADNAQLTWPGDGVNDNPWAVTLKTRDDRRMSRTLMSALAATADPRIAVYAQPVVDSTAYPSGYGGMPNGLLADSAGKWTRTASRPGAVFFPGVTTYGSYGTPAGLTTPSTVMTFAELQFIRAEAAERGLGGLTPGQAAGFYASAITASMQQWGVSGAATATFLAQPAVAYRGGTAGLRQIGMQKWVALYGNGPQAWAEWRRTCQPSTIRPGPAAVVDYVPRRFYYSTGEASVNATNLNAAITRQGPDNFRTRMYWDKNPTAAPTYVDAASCGPAT